MLQPAEDVAPLSTSGFPMLQHAQFATHALRATRYQDGELYPAGDYPNQGAPGLGVPQYVAGGQSLQGQDLVVWYTTGFTHIPTVENYPVMTADTTGSRSGRMVSSTPTRHWTRHKWSDAGALATECPG